RTTGPPPARRGVESHKKRRAGRASTAGGLARGAFTPLRSLFLDTGLLVRPIFSTHYVLNNNDLSADFRRGDWEVRPSRMTAVLVMSPSAGRGGRVCVPYRDPPALPRCLPDRSGGRGVTMTVLVGILALAAASVPQSDDSAAARVRDRDPVEHVDPDLRGRTCGSISVSSPGQPRVRERFSARMTLDLMFRMAFSSRDEDAHLVTF